VDCLLHGGSNVVVLDDFSTGCLRNLSHHQGNPNLQVISVNLAEPGTIVQYFEGVDWVFHLAALADIVPSIQRPLDYHKANVDGTVAVLEAVRASGVRRLIYAASSSCYGIPSVYPTSESAPIQPQYPYALTKFLGEACVLHWSQVFGLPAVSLRLFNVFGPRSRTSGTYGAVFGTFLAQKLHDQPFTVVGDGTQTRDFIFVTDVVDAMVKAAESDLMGEVLNVGSGDSQSVNRLVRLLGGDVVHIPKRPGEPDCTLADISKIQGLLNWHPKVSLEDGVAVMLENIDYWREAPVWTPERIASATKEWFRYLSRGHSHQC